VSEIFVALLDEGVDVWRPVEAQHLHDNIYRIEDQPYDRDVETWQFEPGTEVVCEMVDASDGPILAATRSNAS
jgi:hypothetical protein